LRRIKPSGWQPLTTRLEAREQLRAAGVATAELDADLLLAHVLGISRGALLLQQPTLAAVQAEAFTALITRRAAHEPLAYIVGEQEFWSLPFRVTRSTLIPRPDSETLVEAALAAFPDTSQPLEVIDLGTGSGCLLLSLLHERPRARGLGVDQSPEALDVAQNNAKHLGLADRTLWRVSHWFDAVAPGRAFDLLLCNPPYIPSGDIATLMPDVRDFEPATALDGGPDGLAPYRTLIPLLNSRLTPQGIGVFEIGHDQAFAVMQLAHEYGFRADLRKDLAGRDRCVTVRR
jgi:release factor glutamine methyltransferase